jgi:flavin reductase (DIM6/NTAB) family NADH-FMN oxidoreductase RutF
LYQLYDIIDIKHPETGAVPAVMILGVVKGIHVRKDVLNEKNLVDITKFKPISRLGDISYARTSDPYRIPRPAWKEHEEEVAALRSKA